MQSLDKKNIKIGFLGTMNSMPMYYAIEFINRGYEVRYLVDVSKNDTLSRPENHFPDISYPYPSWIYELFSESSSTNVFKYFDYFKKLLVNYLPNIFNTKAYKFAESCDVVFLSGKYLIFSFFLNKSIYKIFLSYGSDLDVYCKTTSFSLFNFKSYLKTFLFRQSLKHLDMIVKFPKGLNIQSDHIVENVIKKKLNIDIIERYELMDHYLKKYPRHPKSSNGTLNILCPVRNLFLKHEGIGESENKGNDIIIRGLAKYINHNKNVKIHLFNKGPDTQKIKELCFKLGIDSNVIWHDQIPFYKLAEMFVDSDIVFDQVGPHWMGIGMVALYLGRPLITNYRPEVLHRFWKTDSTPICQAANENEIFDWLIRLEDPNLRKDISIRSIVFSDNFIFNYNTINKIESRIMKKFTQNFSL